MNTRIHVHQCALIISMRCTLKCKLCLVYAPYYDNPKDYVYEDLAKSIDAFFEVVDSVGTLNIQGGEPLLHKDLVSIILKVAEYSERIGKILLTTNGTLMISDNVLNVLKKINDKIQVNISDYGEDLSKCANGLYTTLTGYGIACRVINYHGENVHFGGWLDFTDHTLKHFTEEDLLKNAGECGYRQGGNLAILPGELYFCYRVRRRVELGLIDKDERVFVNLFSNEDIASKRSQVERILNAPYTPACAYCVGKRSGAKHYPAAEQLTDAECKAGVEKFNILEK